MHFSNRFDCVVLLELDVILTVQGVPFENRQKKWHALAPTWRVGAGTKIEFLTDQGETLRNVYLLYKNFKTGVGFFVTRTVFSHQLCPRSL